MYAARQNVVTPQPEATSLFHQDWWLRAAAGEALEKVQVKWDGMVVGELSFVRRSVLGMRLLKLPPYTRTLGPVLCLPAAKLAAHTRNLRRVVADLIKALPAHERFQLFLDPADPSVLAFALAGCKVEHDFTFRVPVELSENSIWDQMDSKERNLIRSAEKKLSFTGSDDCERFIDMSRSQYEKGNRHRFDAIRRIFAEAFARDQALVLVASDSSGVDAATAILVWNSELLYYWQAARNVQAITPGANSYLIWQAVRIAKSRGLCFDLDGYHSESSARFALKFGMQPVVRPSVTHMNVAGSIAHVLATYVGRVPQI